MLLYLLRHAEAADVHPDSERPLTPKGTRDARSLGELLHRQEVALPAQVWSSPYQRARETTAALLEPHRSAHTIEHRDGLTPYDDPADLLPELAEVEEDLLIVGHNPHLSVLAGYLLGGLESAVTVHYRKCTLMRFERVKRFSNDEHPTWVLNWMIPPKLYRPAQES